MLSPIFLFHCHFESCDWKDIWFCFSNTKLSQSFVHGNQS